MSSITLTQIATTAAQEIGHLFTGQSLSATQLTDALQAANFILDGWTSEEVQSILTLISAQNADLADLLAAQARTIEPLVTASSLSAGTYTAPSFTAASFAPGAEIQFANTTTALTVPGGYARALMLYLAIEIAPQYKVLNLPPALRGQAAQAKANAQVVLGRIIGLIPEAAYTQIAPAAAE